VEKHSLLIHCRQFDWAKYGLTVPSPAVFDFRCAIQRVVQINIEGVIAGLHVMGCLYDIVLQTIDCNSYSILYLLCRTQVYVGQESYSALPACANPSFCQNKKH